MSRVTSKRPVWMALAAIPLLFASIAALQARIDVYTRSEAQQKEELLFRSGPLLKKLSLGYDSLLADIYWTRAVQFYGSKIGDPGKDFQLLWPLLDVTTSLDPKLIIAYRFGSIFLSEPPPIGAGRTDLAIDLVKRGVAANPDNWRLDTDLGFLYYWRLKDFPDAAAAYLRGSKNPQAPAWVKIMAARIAAKGGSLETSQMIWAGIYSSSHDSRVRKMAFAQMQSLLAQRDIEALDGYVREYHKRFGHFPAATSEMRDAGMLKGIPLDPDGFPYLIGPDGKAQVDPKSPVVILPIPKGVPGQPAKKD